VADDQDLNVLLNLVRDCRLCEAHLPLGPRPVVQLGKGARILIIGQAPGTKVHDSAIPWNDASGECLRDWMGIGPQDFYDPQKMALMPMGFCYPGKGKSGDLPPRPECAPYWHDRIKSHLNQIRLTLLVGQYAQKAYWPDGNRLGLTENVRHYKQAAPHIMALPHPSWRVQKWMSDNGWFESEVLPVLRTRIAEIL